MASSTPIFALLSTFYFIMTVALGSTVATILLSSDDASAEELIALVPAGRQFIIAWVSAPENVRKWPAMGGHRRLPA